MTAPVSLVVVPSAEAIAFLPAFASGEWRDGQGRNLIQFLDEEVGSAERQRLLDEADRLLHCEAMPVDTPTKHPVPDFGGALTWWAGGTFHDPIPMRQVTVCGLRIPAGTVFTAAAGRPCGQCFEVAS